MGSTLCHPSARRTALTRLGSIARLMRSSLRRFRFRLCPTHQDFGWNQLASWRGTTTRASRRTSPEGRAEHAPGLRAPRLVGLFDADARRTLCIRPGSAAPEVAMGALSPVHLILVLLIALIVFGPGKLPEVGEALGRGIREFRKAADNLEDEVRGDKS